MKTNLYKRILGLSLLAIMTFVFLLENVSAETIKECDKLTNDQILTMFNFKVNYAKGAGSSEWMKISFSPTEDSFKNVTFDIVGVNDGSFDSYLSTVCMEYFDSAFCSNNIRNISANTSISMPALFYNPHDGGDGETMIVSLTSNELTKKDDSGCKGKINVKLAISKYGDVQSGTYTSGTVINESTSSNYVEMNCNNATTEFEKEFCKAKTIAQQSPVYSGKLDTPNFTGKFTSEKNTFAKLVGDNKFSNFKCGIKFCSSANETNCVPPDKKDASGNEYPYYINKSYMYGSGVTKEVTGKYHYYYSPGEHETEDISCKVNCEEAVTVEYGPPVASTAGLCFEYKVKVTSRVMCGRAAESNLKKPNASAPYCTPSPICTGTNSSGQFYTVTEGGPNKKFDDCINSCDGGKYTDKCSKKCYKKVYESNNNKTLFTDEYNEAVKLGAFKAYTSDAAKNAAIDACIDLETKYNGCYYRSGTSVKWAGKYKTTPGRWYELVGWKNYHRGANEYFIDNENEDSRAGIYIHNHVTWTCGDTCWWSTEGCPSGKYYLNEEQAKKDVEDNIKEYNKVEKACEAAASCGTSTAEYTISVDYLHDVNGTLKDETISFPYSTSGGTVDSLKSTEGSCENQNSDFAKDKKSTILDYAGCYKGYCGNEVSYMTEWSFPGSWINGKTGDLSYYIDNNDGSWKEKPKKFCIPLDAKGVNQKWYRYYMNKTFVDQYDTSVERDVFEEKCVRKGSRNSITNIKTIVDSDIAKWNINAQTKNFGYFGWNINMSCFYAITTSTVTTEYDENQQNTEITCEDDPECCSGVSYDIRPADTREVFPDPDGTGSRPQGFNWTDFAGTPGNPEDVDYPVVPEKYLSEIQQSGYNTSIYSDQYLDYRFELTPALLNEMREYMKGKKYSDFEGDIDEIKPGEVVFYSSSLFRNTKNGSHILANTKHDIPNKVPKCNNITNYSDYVNCHISE